MWIQGSKPLEAPARCRLGPFDRVVLGRTEGRRAIKWDDRLLSIRIADSRMSADHAELVRDRRAWVIVDRGSKNGVHVNGVRVDRAELSDGDVVELGHTFLLYRHDLPARRDDPFIRDLGHPPPFQPMLVTLSPTVEACFTELAKVARSNEAILITGETGTGKEGIASAVHALSRPDGDFVAVNCGAIPDGLAESQFFGHRKGAFTGADDDHIGFLRAADGGTLFLDEIGDLAPPAQAALLRALQQREVTPVGATRALPTDFRLIAATHHDLREMVARKAFRADLFARIAGFRVELPPLRERREDLGWLIASILGRKVGSRTSNVELAPEAVHALIEYPFPLNIRELEQALGSAVVLADYGEIGLAHLPSEIRDHVPDVPRDPDALRQTLVSLLESNQGNVMRVAAELGKNTRQIYRWLHVFGLDPKQYRKKR